MSGKKKWNARQFWSEEVLTQKENKVVVGGVCCV